MPWWGGGAPHHGPYALHVGSGAEKNQQSHTPLCGAPHRFSPTTRRHRHPHMRSACHRHSLRHPLIMGAPQGARGKKNAAPPCPPSHLLDGITMAVGCRRPSPLFPATLALPPLLGGMWYVGGCTDMPEIPSCCPPPGACPGVIFPTAFITLRRRRPLLALCTYYEALFGIPIHARFSFLRFRPQVPRERQRGGYRGFHAFHASHSHSRWPRWRFAWACDWPQPKLQNKPSNKNRASTHTVKTNDAS